MNLLCVDIGNTHTHFGCVVDDGSLKVDSMPSRALESDRNPLTRLLEHPGPDSETIEGLACCSVVPDLNPHLLRTFAAIRPGLPRFLLTHRAGLGLPLTYPAPETIGPDRLANAAGAQFLHGAPAIIVDAGTAVTCDVITPDGGFEGGIIAPGVGLMRHYLHDRTVLLPMLENDDHPVGAIGKSTIEAMQLGCALGFRGMIEAFIAALRRDLAARGMKHPKVIVTGGTAHLLISLTTPAPIHVPDLTLRGLHRAFLLNPASESRIPPDECSWTPESP
ncbi:MAG: type III pantothenate kinase [Opitutaceae bacterium]